ncbi:MAG: prephenate/arogenate dehydrogenase family protein [Candidatus Puniceispirillaceae bacterium]
MSHLYQKIAIIGVGLVGASIALVLQQKKLTGTIAIYDKSDEARDMARDLKIGDVVTDSISDCVADADLIFLAVPVGAMAAVMADCAPHLKQGCVITDVGSTKNSVIRDVKPLMPEGCHFIAGHPMAGTEFSGPAAGFPSLFQDRFWLLVPDGAARQEIDRLAELLQSFGAITEEMDVKYHDRVVAITSHLPHLIAYTIVGTAVDLEADLKNDVIRFSASGFRDFTRIAASDPTMWRDVFLNNDEAVLEMLQRFNEDLSYLQRAIRWQEGDKLFDLFSRTRSIRKSIIEAGQD